jgi:ABC-type glycerol-3-phosphate transport system substrate-binding protein
MRHSRWYLLALLALVVAGLVVVGTAGGARHKSGASGTISVIGKWTGAEQKSFEAVISAFNKKNPDVKVKYTPGGDNTPQLVSTAVAGGNPPDIAILPQPGLMRDLARRGAAKPITFAKATLLKNEARVWVSLGSVNGKLYGLFFKVANKSTVWYNTKLFKDAGAKPASTWGAFLKTAKTLKASGAKAYAIAAADGWTLTDLFENIYLRQAGPKKYDLLTNHKIKWTDASVKATLRTMAKIVGDTANIPGGKSGALQTDFPTSVTQVLTDKPKAAMIIEGDFVPSDIKANVKPIKDYNVFAFPSIKASTRSSIMGGGDTVIMLKDNPAARALVSFLATPAAGTVWAQRGGFSSPNRGVKPSAYKDALTRKNTLALTHAKIFGFDMSDLQPASFGSTTGQGEWKLFQDFVSNPKNVNGTAAKLEAAAKKAYGK